MRDSFLILHLRLSFRIWFSSRGLLLRWNISLSIFIPWKRLFLSNRKRGKRSCPFIFHFLLFKFYWDFIGNILLGKIGIKCKKLCRRRFGNIMRNIVSCPYIFYALHIILIFNIFIMENCKCNKEILFLYFTHSAGESGEESIIIDVPCYMNLFVL